MEIQTVLGYLAAMNPSPTIKPYLLGSGGAGQAIARALASLSVTDPELGLLQPDWLPRGTEVAIPATLPAGAIPTLFIANPHALHAPAIIAASRAGFPMIFCEKPTCTSQAQIRELEAISTPTAVFHGYRQMWGPQTLKEMLTRGELGELISVEGRYWQSSAAARALAAPAESKTKGWKGDPKLAGEFDVFLDLGTHWADLASYLYGAPPSAVQGWRSYANAEDPTRDTHVQLMLDFPRGGRGFASISKTVHGATNFLELNLIGTRKAATWNFLSPDEIAIGTGRDRGVLVRKQAEYGAKLPPFHGAGWLEGYIEIIRQGLRETALKVPAAYPRLNETLPLMRAMFDVRWSDGR